MKNNCQNHREITVLVDKLIWVKEINEVDRKTGRATRSSCIIGPIRCGSQAKHFHLAFLLLSTVFAKMSHADAEACIQQPRLLSVKEYSETGRCPEVDKPVFIVVSKMTLMENHMFSSPYEGCDIVIRCDDAPNEPIYNTMTALSANSRYFRHVLEGRTPIYMGYTFEEITQDTDHYDTFSTNISQGMFFTLLDLWYNNNSVLDLVDYYGKDAIGIYVVLKRIESDKADLLRDAIVQFIRYDKPMANEFLHKSLRMQEYELFHHFRRELPAVFEELFLKYQSNVPVFSKRDLKRILHDYDVHATNHYIPPGQRIQLPKPADFTKPGVGFNVKMLTSDGLYLYASSEMVEKAYFDGQWFWTRQNAHQIDEGKPMIFFETKYPSLIMKQVLHEVHSNAPRELPLELIAYIYNVAFALGFNLICGRMQTLLSRAIDVNAQTVELAKFWGVDEIKEKLIRKMPSAELLHLVGLKKGLFLFGLEEIGVRTSSRSSPYFSITEVRIILRDTFSKIVF